MDEGHNKSCNSHVSFSLSFSKSSILKYKCLSEKFKSRALSLVPSVKEGIVGEEEIFLYPSRFFQLF